MATSTICQDFQQDSACFQIAAIQTGLVPIYVEDPDIRIASPTVSDFDRSYVNKTVKKNEHNPSFTDLELTTTRM